MLEKALAVAKASPVCKLQSPAEDQSPLKIKVFTNEECDQLHKSIIKGTILKNKFVWQLLVLS